MKKVPAYVEKQRASTLQEWLKLQTEEQAKRAVRNTEEGVAAQLNNEMLEALRNRDLRPREAAIFLGVHVNTIKRMLHAKQLPGAYRIGIRGDWRIPRSSLHEYKLRGGTI